MKYYHATSMANLASISTEGIKPSFEGIVYLTTTPEDSLKFMLVHLVLDVVVCEVDLPKNKVEETFDHSEAFFKCRCFGHRGTIPPSKITKYTQYDLRKYMNP